MKNLKILYICYEDITGFNGAIRHVTEIVRGLARHGNAVTLCVPRLQPGRKPPALGKVVIRNIPVLPFKKLRPLSFLLLSHLLLPWIFFRTRPDIVYIRDIKFTFLPGVLARLFRVPAVLEVNNLLDEAQKIRGVGRCTYQLLELFHRLNLRNAQRVVTVTQGIREDMISRYALPPDKITIITNGVDLERFQPMAMLQAREQSGLSREYKYVGFVGGLFPWHGLDLLVKAAPLVLKEIPVARFLIVGSGMMENSLKQMIAEQKLEQAFLFTGSVPFDAVPRYVNSFSITVVFFKKVRKDPGDPIKLYEYLACGKPVVASNVKGYGDLVESIGAGISVDAEDPTRTAAAIINLLQDDELAREMGEKGAAYARDHFGWDRKVTETLQLLQKLL